MTDTQPPTHGGIRVVGPVESWSTGRAAAVGRPHESSDESGSAALAASPGAVLPPGLLPVAQKVRCPECLGRTLDTADVPSCEEASSGAPASVPECSCGGEGVVSVAFGISLVDDRRHLWMVDHLLEWPLWALCGLTVEASELVVATVVEDEASAAVEMTGEDGQPVTGQNLCIPCAALMVLPGTGEVWRNNLS